MIYITKERRYELRNPRVMPTSAADLSYLLFKASRAGFDPVQPITWHYERYEKIIEQYLHPRPRVEMYAIVLGALDIVRRELQRRFPQESMTARKAIDLFAEDFYHDNLVDVNTQLLRHRGDV